MLTFIQGSVVERVQQIMLGSGLQITQDTDGLATLDTNPASFMTQAQADARYSLLGHTHAAADIVSGVIAVARLGTGTPSASVFLRGDGAWIAPTFAQIGSKPTTIAGYGITDFNSLGDARWSLLGHTHTFASLTSIPTTIAGYGITDFNSLGDARWSLLGHTHTFASLTSKPTTISGYGITDFNSLGDARWGQKAAANTFTDLQTFSSGPVWTTAGWVRMARVLQGGMFEFAGTGRQYGLGNSLGILYGMTAIGETSGDAQGYWMTVNNLAVNFPGTVAVGAFAGGAIVAGSVVSRRGPTEGAILFGDALTRYLYTDYTKYYFGGSDRLSAGGYEFNVGNAGGNYIDGQVSSFGSFRAVGSYAGYAGIDFNSASAIFMVLADNAKYWGFYNTAISGWLWLFDDAQTMGVTGGIATRQQFIAMRSMNSFTSGGLIFANDVAAIKGRVHWDGSGFGLLNDSGNWVVRLNNGVGLGGSLYGGWDFDTLPTVSVSGASQRTLRPIIYSGSAPTSSDTAPDGTLWLKT